MLFIDYLLLATGFIFTFFIPGYLIVETFFGRLSKTVKLPLYLVLSVLVSTYTVYFLSLILGYSKFTIILSFLVFAFWFLYKITRTKYLHIIYPKKHRSGLVISFFFFVIFIISLYPAIFFRYKNYFVMSADNWQDTAMHMSIIQSISQGNFPPQAPYYSGTPLSYYYFTDFHTAIISTLTDRFVPRILILDNSLFVLAFSLSLYTLAFYVTKEQKKANLSLFLGMLGGNFMFVKFFQDLAKSGFSNFLNLISSGAYAMEFGKLMQVTPITDYFLQNRPMMVGLPTVILVALLVLRGWEKKDFKRLFLAGLLTGMLFKFQMFAFVVSISLFVLAAVVNLGRNRTKSMIQGFLLFFGPIAVLVTFFSLGNPATAQTPIEMITDSFSLGPWDRNKQLLWFIEFHLANFGSQFILVLFFLIALGFKKHYRQKSYLFLIFWFLLMFILPHLVKFTIYEGDMLKFFYFMAIPMAIISGTILGEFFNKKIGLCLCILVVLVSSLTSLLTLAGSFFNRNFAYSLEDYKVGLWIREQTPPKSVFLELPRVHSPAADIGGRLRTLSYINWPYSHGLNKGEDNVFARLEAVESFFNNPNDKESLSILSKYKINYIYYGSDEKNQFPEAKEKLNSNSRLNLVYSLGGIDIYLVNNPPTRIY